MSDTPPEPSRPTVAAVFAAVVDGTTSREDASRWAMQWVGASDSGIKDDAIWSAMTLLGGIDLRHGQGESYLYSIEQIEGWRSDLLRAP